MTSPQPDGARDWDAEFEAIAKHLRPHTDDATPDSSSRPASRQTFEHGFDTSTGGAPSDQAVPGFRAQWRLPNDDEPPTSSFEEPAAPASQSDRDALLDDEDDTFVPPEPQPFDADDPSTGIMLGFLVVGPLWLLYLLFFDRNAATLWWSIAAAMSFAGFVMLVARQPKSREDDDDDGARV